jgi:ABC-type sugar transport system ATPase subunit
VPLLQTQGLTRRFPGVLALDHVDFAADQGEVHAICGANGAGKSTFMNILAGALPASSGTIVIDGVAAALASPAEARAAGVSIVYQEFSSVPELSVADNIFLGREFTRGPKLVDRARARDAARAVLERHGIRLDPDAPVSSLSVADRQLVELARALSTEARILVLDEPTAVLSLAEQDKLFSVVRALRDRGLLVLYISHRLEEIFALADRVTVMRDGRIVGTRATADLTQRELARLMTGRDVQQQNRPDSASRGDAQLRLSGIGDTELTLHRGEIFGLAGLIGSGRTWIARRIAGLEEPAGLTMRLDGSLLDARRGAGLEHGIVYLTEDRKRDGIFAALPVVPNATAASLRDFSPGGLLAWRRERQAADQILRRLRLAAASLQAPAGSLSGGNQQKILFARAILARPRVLVCDEPTRGVDVGAKQEIYALLRQLSAEGVTIIVVSSEFPELLGLCDRLGVVRDGRVHAIRDNVDLDEHQLMELVTGAAELAHAAA